MNFCGVAYATLAYAFGNMVLIPVNAVAQGDLDAPGILIGGVTIGVAFVGLHKAVKLMSEFELTPDAL